MATILEFKLAKKPKTSPIASDKFITSSVNDVKLMIHHALHGTSTDNRPTDRQLAAQLLDELSAHIKRDYKDESLVLSHTSSSAIVNRYPENINLINRSGESI